VSDLSRAMWPVEGDKDNPISILTTRYLEDRPDTGDEPITPEGIARLARDMLASGSSDEPVESWAICVERVLEQMRHEKQEVAV